MENEQLDSIKIVYLMSDMCILWIRWPDSNINSVVSFQESSFNDNVWTSLKVRKKVNTTFTSQVLVYFGKEGLCSNTPFMNLTTKGWLPTGLLSGKTMTDDSALWAVFKQLYPMPDWKSSVKNSITSVTVGCKGSQDRLVENLCHRAR